MNLKNVQTNFNQFSIGFASYVNNNTIKNLWVVDVIGKLGSKATNAHILEVHLEELKKQGISWKPRSHLSLPWAFFKVNNNQPIDLNANQIMRYIIYHNQVCGRESLALCMRCYKGFITYHKANGITAMKKYVEDEHVTLLAKYLEHVTNQLRSTCD